DGRSVEIPPHPLPRGFVLIGGAGAELVDAAVDVGVRLPEVARDGVQHRLRLLRRRCVVEVDERFAVDLPRKDREIGAGRRHTQTGAELRRHPFASTSARSLASCSNSSTSSAARSGSTATPSSTWPAKAWISMSRASAYVMPRARR